MLSSKQRKFLKSKAHHLKPVAWIGDNGLTEKTISEIKYQLEIHELIKIKCSNSAIKKIIQETIYIQTDALSVGNIGNIFILYRPDPNNPRMIIPQN